MDLLYAYCARAGKGTRVHLWIFYLHIVREPLIEFGLGNLGQGARLAALSTTPACWAWSDGKGGHRKRVATAPLIMKHYEPGSSNSAGHCRRLLHILAGTQLILPPASQFVAVVPSVYYTVHPPAQVCRPRPTIPSSSVPRS